MYTAHALANDKLLYISKFIDLTLYWIVLFELWLLVYRVFIQNWVHIAV